MGRIFLEHIGGTKLYACSNCDTNLTNKGELMSTKFTGATGKKRKQPARLLLGLLGLNLFPNGCNAMFIFH